MFLFIHLAIKTVPYNLSNDPKTKYSFRFFNYAISYAVLPFQYFYTYKPEFTLVDIKEDTPATSGGMCGGMPGMM